MRVKTTNKNGKILNDLYLRNDANPKLYFYKIKGILFAFLNLQNPNKQPETFYCFCVFSYRNCFLIFNQRQIHEIIAPTIEVVLHLIEYNYYR